MLVVGQSRRQRSGTKAWVAIRAHLEAAGGDTVTGIMAATSLSKQSVNYALTANEHELTTVIGVAGTLKRPLYRLRPRLRLLASPKPPPVYPCIDAETRRYKSFPCSQCQADGCVFGKKPVVKVAVKLEAGQKACEVCDAVYAPAKNATKTRYCGDPCRRKAIAKKRREERLHATYGPMAMD